jgi:5-methylcytosine-specific restriction endonuclease McrA
MINETIDFLENKCIELKRELQCAEEKLKYEKIFDVIRRDVKPYFDEAENEMRITNLKIACENILKLTTPVDKEAGK